MRQRGSVSSTAQLVGRFSAVDMWATMMLCGTPSLGDFHTHGVAVFGMTTVSLLWNSNAGRFVGQRSDGGSATSSGMCGSHTVPTIQLMDAFSSCMRVQIIAHTRLGLLGCERLVASSSRWIRSRWIRSRYECRWHAGLVLRYG